MPTELELIALETEFTLYIPFVKRLVLSLPKSADRSRAAMWVKLLRSIKDDNFKKLRNEHLKLLLFALHRRSLVGVFEKPPPDEIESFHDGLTLMEMTREIIEITEKQASAGNPEDAESSPLPQIVTNLSADMKEYAAAQYIPKFGAHCYFAVSNEPIQMWLKSGNATYPETSELPNLQMWEQAFAKLDDGVLQRQAVIDKAAAVAKAIEAGTMSEDELEPDVDFKKKIMVKPCRAVHFKWKRGSILNVHQTYDFTDVGVADDTIAQGKDQLELDEHAFGIMDESLPGRQHVVIRDPFFKGLPSDLPNRRRHGVVEDEDKMNFFFDEDSEDEEDTTATTQTTSCVDLFNRISNNRVEFSGKNTDCNQYGKVNVDCSQYCSDNGGAQYKDSFFTPDDKCNEAQRRIDEYISQKNQIDEESRVPQEYQPSQNYDYGRTRNACTGMTGNTQNVDTGMTRNIQFAGTGMTGNSQNSGANTMGKQECTISIKLGERRIQKQDNDCCSIENNFQQQFTPNPNDYDQQMFPYNNVVSGQQQFYSTTADSSQQQFSCNAAANNNQQQFTNQPYGDQDQWLQQPPPVQNWTTTNNNANNFNYEDGCYDQDDYNLNDFTPQVIQNYDYSLNRPPCNDNCPDSYASSSPPSPMRNENNNCFGMSSSPVNNQQTYRKPPQRNGYYNMC